MKVKGIWLFSTAFPKPFPTHEIRIRYPDLLGAENLLAAISVSPRLVLVIDRRCNFADVRPFPSFGIPDFIQFFAKILSYEGFELVAGYSC
jgi:hypothetical protein